MSRYFITGGGGFIGRNLVRVFGQEPGQHELVVPERKLDLRSPEAVRTLMSGNGKFDYIVHLADMDGDADWARKNAGAQFMANNRMALNILEAWRDFQSQARLVGFSSLWAYPESIVEVREEQYWNGRMHAPTEHYGISKKLLGVGIDAFRKEYGMRGTMLVLGNVYGPGDTSSRVIPSLIRRMQANPDRLEVWGDGSQTRDFVFIDDQVQGVLLHQDFDGELLNITTGQCHSLKEVILELADLMPYRGEIVFSPSKSAGVSNRRVSVDLAQQATGWPQNFKLHSLRDGLKKTVESFRRE